MNTTEPKKAAMDLALRLAEYRDDNETKPKTINSIDKSDVLVDVVEDILKTNLKNNTAVKQFRSLN